MKKVLRQCAQICIKPDLIAGNVLFVDGTKVRANAARHRAHDRKYYEKLPVDIDRRIERLFADCEAIDRREQGTGSYAGMNKKLAKARDLRCRVREAPDTFAAGGRKLVNQTDPDCAVMRSVQGSHAGYNVRPLHNTPFCSITVSGSNFNPRNTQCIPVVEIIAFLVLGQNWMFFKGLNVQSVVDDKHGLIVNIDVVSDTGDVNQFARQIEQANEALEKSCEVACADAGYADTDEPEKIDVQGIKVIVPSQRQALRKEESPFSKSHFVYDKEQDSYICPEGCRLYYQGTDKSAGKRHYLITDKHLCFSCKHYGVCAGAKKGRKINRHPDEEAKPKFEAQYQEAGSQEIYSRRKTRSEHPFGHIKRNLKTDSFLLRGREGVQAGTSLLGACFNVARMITIFGVSTLIERLVS